jgi:hypothetical protein
VGGVCGAVIVKLDSEVGCQMCCFIAHGLCSLCTCIFLCDSNKLCQTNGIVVFHFECLDQAT